MAFETPPIGPDDTFVHYLNADDQRPDSERPAIVVRYGSSRFWNRFQADLAAVLDDKALNDSETYARVEQLVETAIADKRNVASLGEAMTDRQLLQLASSLRGMSYLAEADRKNSESPSRSVAAASAESALTDAA